MINFKFILTAVFAVSIVVSIIVFASFSGVGRNSGTVTANLVVWGTISEQSFNSALFNSSLKGSKDIKISYVRKDVASFDADLIEALADGIGPDIILIREDSLYKQRNKILTIPYKSFTERDFKDRFIEQGELFLSPEGVTAVPFIVDPMVMYWNRNIFTNNLIAQPPKYWDEVFTLIDKITKKDSNANILDSAIALGEWNNITNAKELVSMLFLQSGTPITRRSGSEVESVLSSQLGKTTVPGLDALNFYTQFSNPTGASYTWNRSLPTSQNFFLSGDLAMYIGFASELFSIRQKNSNLNFDVTYVPQIRNTNKQIVFAHMYGLAILKQSKQAPGAFVAINALTEAGALKALEASTSLPPVRRDLLADKPTDAYRSVFYNSALISGAWLDPDTSASWNTFRDMIDSITSGKSRVSDALNRADEELKAQLK